MLRTQTMDIKNEVFLDELYLEEDKEMSIRCQDGNFIKIANLNNKICIFVKDMESIKLEQWKGGKPYRNRIMEIEDELEN